MKRRQEMEMTEKGGALLGGRALVTCVGAMGWSTAGPQLHGASFWVN